MERKKIESILKAQVENNALDKKIVSLLLDNFEEVSIQVKEKQLESLELFEMKFLNINMK